MGGLSELGPIDPQVEKGRCHDSGANLFASSTPVQDRFFEIRKSKGADMEPAVNFTTSA
jgi:hypothetical protein